MVIVACVRHNRNRKMEDVEGVPISEMVDSPFYEVFKNGDKKWIIPYADAARNGVEREIRDYSPEIGKNLIITVLPVPAGLLWALPERA